MTGFLRCADEAEAARVQKFLPEHIRLTRAEPGCLSFDVTETQDPLVWSVAERFLDRAAFDAHQARAGASAWAEATKGIARDYEIVER
nr:antibiotic biosynthesis monooxygenase [Pseudoruegeria sp. HB172150]